MSDRHYTFIIVPGSRAKLFRLRLRRGIVAGLAATAVVGLLTVGLLPIIYYKAAQRSQELAALQKENHVLKKASREFDESVSSLREQVSYFESRATKFALMAGVENLPSAQGVGGLRQSVPESTASGAPSTEEIDSLKERSSVLKKSFELLESVYKDQSLLLASTPSIAPVKGMIAYGYSWRKDPFTGERAFHNGLDIVAPKGTPVRAPADGLVVKSWREAGYGNVVYLSHGNGITTRYAHLDEFAVRPGQDVARGDIIGYVGNTGRSLGAHLHYEILVNNAKVDPSQYILDDRLSY
ncbi:MAG TPA: M23 family metallopeptidase [Candidatus Polarisedimenticolia bacterium]|nr:M23 family metallopeptidase [Candidatus Polarisedimenticolia bacterium]